MEETTICVAAILVAADRLRIDARGKRVIADQLTAHRTYPREQVLIHELIRAAKDNIEMSLYVSAITEDGKEHYTVGLSKEGNEADTVVLSTMEIPASNLLARIFIASGYGLED